MIVTQSNVDLIHILAQKISQVKKGNQNPDTHWHQDQCLFHLKLESLFYTLLKAVVPIYQHSLYTLNCSKKSGYIKKYRLWSLIWRGAQSSYKKKNTGNMPLKSYSHCKAKYPVSSCSWQSLFFCRNFRSREAYHIATVRRKEASNPPALTPSAPAVNHTPARRCDLVAPMIGHFNCCLCRSLSQLNIQGPHSSKA